MIVVTGPTGNVGAELVRLLAAGSTPFRVAAHDPARLAREHAGELPAVAFDYDDRAAWPAVLDGVRTLFLLFPLPHPRTVRTRMIPFVDAAVAALDLLTGPVPQGGAAHTLTGPRRMDFDEAAAVLTDVLGRPVRYARPSYPRFWRRLHRRGVTWDTLLFMTIVYTLTRTGRNEPLTGELAALLGREPTAFEQWARDYKDRFEARAWT